MKKIEAIIKPFKLEEVKDALARSSANVIEDALGVVTLFVLLFAGLNLPLFT